MSKKWLNRRRGVPAASGNGAPPEALRCVPFPNAARTPREGLAPRLQGEGLAPRLLGEVSRPLVMAMVGAMALIAQAEVTDMVIDVPAGTTVTSNEVISGEVRLVKTGLGKLILSAANTYIGGTALQAGVLEVQNRDALGTGAVTVTGSTEQLNQLRFNAPNLSGSNPITNDLVFASSSSSDYPALMLATHTYLSGSIVSHGDLYFATGFESANHFADVYVKFLGPVTIDTGYRIAAAPHCRVAFVGQLSADILEGYRVNGAAENGGNAGSFRLDYANNDAIKKIILDQTCVIFCGANCASNTYFTWTGVTREDGYGYVDINNVSAVRIRIAEMPVYSTTDGGAQILNSGESCPNPLIQLCAKACYVKLDGKMYPSISGYSTKGAEKAYLYNRTHTVDNRASPLFFTSGYTGIGAGTRFLNVTHISGNSGGYTWFDCDSEEVFPKLTTLQTDSHYIYLNENACRDLSRNHRLYVNQTKANTFGLRIPNAGTWLDVYKLNGCLVGESAVKTLPAGEYSSANLTNIQTSNGTIRNWAARTNWTVHEWQPTELAKDNDVLNTNNWDVVALTTFNVPCAWVKFAASGSEATLTNEVHWGGLTFTAAANSFTLKSAANEPAIHLYDNGLTFETKSEDVERTFTIEPQLVLHTNQVWAVPAKDTLVLSAGIATNKFEIGAANAGTITLDGTIPASLVVPAGKLIIAANATLPAKFTEISLGETAQLEVLCEAGEMTVDTFKIGGALAVDGDYQYGNLIIKQRTGVVPSAPTAEAIWDGEGSDTLLTTAANWEGDAAPKFDAGLKMILAKAGEVATVTNGTMAHTVVITNAAESGGPAAFTLQGETTRASDTVFKLYGKLLNNNNTIVPLVLKNITIEGANGVDESVPSFNGNTSISLYANSNPNSKYVLTLNNAVVAKPVALWPGTQNLLYTQPGTTNEFKARLKKTDGGNWITIYNALNSKLVFSGGVTPNKATIYNYGELLITNKAWYSFDTYNGICNVIGRYGSHTRFAVSSNYFGHTTGNQNGLWVAPDLESTMHIDFEANYAIFDSRLILKLSGSATASRSMTVDFHCTTQQVIGTYAVNTELDQGKGTCMLTGEPGSLLIVDAVVDKTDSFSSTNVVQIAGGLGIEKRGAAAMYFRCLPKKLERGERNDATTTGPLTVANGSVLLDEGFSWRNGPVTVSGGKLAFAESNQIGRNQPLAVSGTGMLEIPDGVTITVASATLDGNDVKPGSYTAGSEGIAAHITGSGTLRISAGTYFIIK